MLALHIASASGVPAGRFPRRISPTAGPDRLGERFYGQLCRITRSPSQLVPRTAQLESRGLLGHNPTAQLTGALLCFCNLKLHHPQRRGRLCLLGFLALLLLCIRLGLQSLTQSLLRA